MAESRSNITQRSLLTLLESQGYRCALTGRQLTPDTASVDHRVPMARGGTHELENLWIVHGNVNRAKGALTVREFIDLCLEVVRHQMGSHPPLAPPPPRPAQAESNRTGAGVQFALFEESQHG